MAIIENEAIHQPAEMKAKYRAGLWRRRRALSVASIARHEIATNRPGKRRALARFPAAPSIWRLPCRRLFSRQNVASGSFALRGVTSASSTRIKAGFFAFVGRAARPLNYEQSNRRRIAYGVAGAHSNRLPQLFATRAPSSAAIFGGIERRLAGKFPKSLKS